MFSSRKPGPGTKLPYWDFVTLKLGEVFRGWLAGPIVGVQCHYLGGTKGCREDLTDGAVECPYCAGSMAKVWRGYVPLWDAFGIRHVSILSERYAHLALSIELHEPIAVTKLKKQGSPIRLEPSDWTELEPPVNRADSRPQDLRPWLVRLWGDDVLETWVNENPQLDGADISEPVPRKRRAKAKPIEEPSKPPTREDVALLKRTLAERLKIPDSPTVKNGKH